MSDLRNVIEQERKIMQNTITVDFVCCCETCYVAWPEFNINQFCSILKKECTAKLVFLKYHLLNLNSWNVT